MNVTKEHYEERAEPDERGMLEWEYIFDLYTFSEGPAELTFRQYGSDAMIATLFISSSWSQLVGYQRLLGAAARHLLTRRTGVQVAQKDELLASRGEDGGRERLPPRRGASGVCDRTPAMLGRRELRPRQRALPVCVQGIPVNALEAAAVERKVKELAAKLDTECKYKCRGPGRSVCRDGWCVAAGL